MIHFYVNGKETTEQWAKKHGDFFFKEYTVFNGKKVLIRDIHFKNNKLEGIQRAFYDSGEDYFTCEYIGGERNGQAELRNRYGATVAKWEYKNDVRNGIYTEWYDNKQKKCEIVFVNGHPTSFKGYRMGDCHIHEVGGTYIPEKETLVIEGDWEGNKKFYNPITKEVQTVNNQYDDARIKAVFFTIVERYITEKDFEDLFNTSF